jgi:hypothetical protein
VRGTKQGFGGFRQALGFALDRRHNLNDPGGVLPAVALNFRQPSLKVDGFSVLRWLGE